MGYQISSVYGISPDDTHSYFIFVLGGNYGLVSSVHQWIDNNFKAIAKAIGPQAVIVSGLSESFDTEVINVYKSNIETVVLDKELNFDERAIDRLLRAYEDKYRLANLYSPILIVTDKNPHQVAEVNSKSVFYLIPLGSLRDDGEILQVLDIVITCIRSNNFTALDELMTRKFGKTPFNAVKAFNEVVELKPGIAGFSINLNAIIERFSRSKRRAGEIRD